VASGIRCKRDGCGSGFIVMLGGGTGILGGVSSRVAAVLAAAGSAGQSVVRRSPKASCSTLPTTSVTAACRSPAAGGLRGEPGACHVAGYRRDSQRHEQACLDRGVAEDAVHSAPRIPADHIGGRWPVRVTAPPHPMTASPTPAAAGAPGLAALTPSARAAWQVRSRRTAPGPAATYRVRPSGATACVSGLPAR
jgi:hypothetical protein